MNNDRNIECMLTEIKSDKYMASEILVNIDWGNGLLPEGTKQLPEPMLIFRQRKPLVFIPG